MKSHYEKFPFTYDFDKTFLDNAKIGNVDLISPKIQDNSCSSQKTAIPSPLEKFKSSSCIDAAKILSGSTFSYRFYREEYIRDLRNEVAKFTNPITPNQAYFLQSLHFIDSSGGWETAISTDYEFLSHYRNWQVAVEYFLSLKEEERVEKGIQHFDAAFFRNITLYLDNFHNVKNPISHVIGAGESPLKWWSDLFEKIFFARFQKNIPKSDLEINFSEKYDLIYGVYTFWSEHREEYEKKWRSWGQRSLIYEGESHTKMSKQMFPDADVRDIFYVPSGRLLIYDTLLSEVVPILAQSIKIINTSPTEKNILLVYTLLHRLCYVTRGNLFMLNTLLQRKKDHPDVYESMILNIRNIQSVILEYVHATLSSGINGNNVDNIDEINKVVFNWQRVNEANIFFKERYGREVKLSYKMTEKGKEYVPPIYQRSL